MPLFKGPIGSRLVGASTSSIQVIFPVLAPGSTIVSYKAQFKGGPQVCSVAATLPAPSCTISALPLSGTGYTIELTSSIAGGGSLSQSAPLDADGYTLPTGMLTLCLLL